VTITIEEIQHPTTYEAILYCWDYYTNHYNPIYPPFTFHRYAHSEHIEVLATWGYQGYFFVQSRIKLTVLYGLVSDWTDEIAMRGWIFWRNPISGLWHTEVESQETSVHHWQEAHTYHKEEETDMAFKRARMDTYDPDTHTATITLYPLPGEQLTDVPLAEEIPKYLATQLPDCTVGIFYDVAPPQPQITAIFRTNALEANVPFGYFDRYFEAGDDPDAPAGPVFKTLSPVPPGEVWNLQAAHAQNQQRGQLIIIEVGQDADYISLQEVQTPAGERKCIWNGAVVMKEGDRVRFYFANTQAGDDLYWRAWGYKMKV